jgi:hypothetical protein
MRKSLAKKISVLVVFALLCVGLSGCFQETQIATPTGVYRVWTIELFGNVAERLNIVDFENQQGRSFEFSFGEADFVTVSYIFFVDPQADRTFYAQYASGPTTFRMNGNQIILDSDFPFVGAMDIRAYEGWIIINYTIENQLVYTARYRKTA